MLHFRPRLTSITRLISKIHSGCASVIGTKRFCDRQVVAPPDKHVMKKSGFEVNSFALVAPIANVSSMKVMNETVKMRSCNMVEIYSSDMPQMAEVTRESLNQIFSDTYVSRDELVLTALVCTNPKSREDIVRGIMAALNATNLDFLDICFIRFTSDFFAKKDEIVSKTLNPEELLDMTRFDNIIGIMEEICKGGYIQNYGIELLLKTFMQECSNNHKYNKSDIFRGMRTAEIALPEIIRERSKATRLNTVRMLMTPTLLFPPALSFLPQPKQPSFRRVRRSDDEIQEDDDEDGLTFVSIGTHTIANVDPSSPDALPCLNYMLDEDHMTGVASKLNSIYKPLTDISNVANKVSSIVLSSGVDIVALASEEMVMMEAEMMLQKIDPLKMISKFYGSRNFIFPQSVFDNASKEAKDLFGTPDRQRTL